MLLIYPFIILWLFSWPALAGAQPLQDSTNKTAASISVKFTSAGIFPYSGCVTNLHTNIDAALSYSTKQLSFFAERSFDLQNNTTGLNYACVGLYRDISLTKKLVFTPAVCYAFSTAAKPAAAPEADIIATLTYSINGKFSIENISMFYSTIESCSQKGLFNRLKLSYKTKLFDVELFAWSNAPLWHNSVQLALSPAIVFKKLTLTKHMEASAALSYYTMPVTEAATSIRNSFIFTLTVPVTL